MSTSSNKLAELLVAQTYLYRFAGSVLIVIGTLGCILNLIIFTKKLLRKNPCSIYLISYNLSNFVYIYVSLFSSTLEVGYKYDPSAKNWNLCRLRLYITVLFNILSPYYLILASIDRVLVTSSNANTRRRSTLRLSYLSVIIGTIFWILFHIHAIISANITQYSPTIAFCYFQSGIPLTFVGYYAVIKEILVLSLMIIFGLWAIKNIRSLKRVRVAPDSSASKTIVDNNDIRSTSSKNRQLALILIMDIIIYTPFSFLFASFLMYQQITIKYVVTLEQAQIQSCLTNIFLFLAGIPFYINCYTNLIISKPFRSEMKKIILCK
ncbi:hypothetical protein I4U23_010721 [Adineta vaga]|nr:hypothetical protein I4U23_010721 [Adineta vaga]